MKKAIGCLCYNEIGNRLYKKFQNSTHFIPTMTGFCLHEMKIRSHPQRENGIWNPYTYI